MGAITNNGRKLANFAGFYKGIQSAGAAIIWRLNGLNSPPPYMNLFALSWVLLAGSLVIALPAMILETKDTVPVEGDLKFTVEAIEDVIGHKDLYEFPQQHRVWVIFYEVSVLIYDFVAHFHYWRVKLLQT